MSNSPPLIRSASNADQEKVIELVASILPDFGFTIDLTTSEADLLDLHSAYFAKSGDFYLIENEEGSLLACAGFFALDKHKVKLRKMYVHPDARGKGLAKYLLEKIISACKQAGFRQIVLETTTEMHAARALYATYGFEAFPAPAQSPRCDIVMLKNIEY